MTIINTLFASIRVFANQYLNSSPFPTVTPDGTELAGGTLKTGLQTVFGVTAVIAVLIITIAGFKYVISRGEPQSIAKAKDAILYAAIGLVISITAFSIVTFVIGRVG